MPFDPAPLLLSLYLAVTTTAILLLIGVPVAYGLASSRSRFKFLAEAAVSLPLVLPPSVLGFYLLLVFAPTSYLGNFLLEVFDIRLVFSFGGIVVASVIYSFPFMVQPVQKALEELPPSLSEAAYTLGKSRWQTFRHVLLPNIKPALFIGAILSFAHTVGEFGVVLMIGGNIPDKTRVASLAVYDRVEALQYGAAHVYSLILLGASFIIIAIVHWINRRDRRKI